MSLLHYTFIFLLINIILTVLILFRNYKSTTALALFLVGILLPAASLSGLYLFSSDSLHDSINFKIYLILNTLTAFSIILLNIHFVAKKNQKNLHQKPIKITPYIFGAIITIINVFLIITYQPQTGTSGQFIDHNSWQMQTILYVMIAMYLISIFLIENFYRFANEYQRRISRLIYIPMAIILVYNIFRFTMLSVFHQLTETMVETTLVVHGISYPVVLIGFFRYRLSQEQIIIPRNTVYSSFSLLISGAAFLAVGLTLQIFKMFKFELRWFDSTLIIFTCCFIGFLFISSGNMRRRIILFVNEHFYSNKYDYRDQFFRLHKSYMEGINFDESVTNLVENMKYAVAAADAFVFLKEPHSHSFVIKKNPEFSTKELIFIPGNDPIVLAFENCSDPLDLKKNSDNKRTSEIIKSLSNDLKKISPTVIYPIWHQKSLVGLLMINLKKRKIDIEDDVLIKVFTQAIGTTYYKEYLQKERIESGQFQSFNQIVSFVIHDIKNQIATLSLLAKNSVTYIENREFQKSLIFSIKNCSDNLSSLVEKLSTSRKGIEINLKQQSVLRLLEKVVESELVQSSKNIEIDWLIKKECAAMVDADALEQIFMNLLKNAIESMTLNSGLIKMCCSPLDKDSLVLIENFKLSPSVLESKKVVLIISDTGCGMNQEYIETKLFRPFETTKDKGMGIGLYQSKIYIEKMNGILLCESQVKKGTTFCIVL
jgi:putative PEP-CTERM system histidine kinase